MVRGSRLFSFFAVFFISSLFLSNESDARGRRFSVCGGGNRGGCGGMVVQGFNDQQNFQNFQNFNLNAADQFAAVIGAGQFGFNQFGVNQFGFNQFGNNQFGFNQFGNNQFGVNQFGLNQFGNGQGLVDPSQIGQVGQVGQVGQFGGIGGVGGNQLAPTLGNQFGNGGGLINMSQISMNTPGVRSLSGIVPLSSNTVAVNGIPVPPGAAGYRFVNGQLFWVSPQGFLMNQNGSISQIGGQQPVIGPGGPGVTNPTVPQPQPPVPSSQPQPPVQSPGPTQPTPPGTSTHDLGVQNTQPSQRPVAPSPSPTKFQKWKKLYNDQKDGFKDKEVDKQVSEVVENRDGENFKMTAFKLDCASQGAPDQVKPAALVMITKNPSTIGAIFGAERETFFMIKADQEGTMRDANSKEGRAKLWEEAKKIEKAKKPADSSAFVRPFGYTNAQFPDFTEIQHRVRPILKDGKVTGFTAAQLLRHKDDVKEEDRWKSTDRDIQMYCKTPTPVVPPSEQVSCDAIPGASPGTLGGSGRVTGWFLNRTSNKCEATTDLGSASPRGPFATQKECEDTVAAGKCKPAGSASSGAASSPATSPTPPATSPVPPAPPAAERNQNADAAKTSRLAAAKTALKNCTGCHSGERYGFKVADDGTPSFPKPSRKLGRVLNAADIAKVVKGQLPPIGNMAEEAGLDATQVAAIEAWSRD